MPTHKQKQAVKIMVNNGSPTEAMRAANYAPSAVRTPKVLTESKGYKELLKSYGLTEELVSLALVEDIKGKPSKRVAELSLASDILGMKNKDTNEGDKTNIFIKEISIKINKYLP